MTLRCKSANSYQGFGAPALVRTITNGIRIILVWTVLHFLGYFMHCCVAHGNYDWTSCHYKFQAKLILTNTKLTLLKLQSCVPLGSTMPLYSLVYLLVVHPASSINRNDHLLLASSLFIWASAIFTPTNYACEWRVSGMFGTRECTGVYRDWCKGLKAGATLNDHNDMAPCTTQATLPLVYQVMENIKHYDLNVYTGPYLLFF